MPDAPSFERDIRPLFREEDVDATEFVFDLASYEDVKENAEDIYYWVEERDDALRPGLVGRPRPTLPELDRRGDSSLDLEQRALGRAQGQAGELLAAARALRPDENRPAQVDGGLLPAQVERDRMAVASLPCPHAFG